MKLRETRRGGIFAVCLFILSFHYANAFDDNEEKPTAAHEWQAGGTVYSGKTIQHSVLLGPILERAAAGGEIFISKQTYGLQPWNAFFNFPEYGICYSFFDLGSPDYVGIVQCLYPYLKFHLFDSGSPLNLHLRTGGGFAYVRKLYNAETNPLNLAFSTHLNIVLAAQLQGVYKISNEWSFFAGVGIMHISNGALRMPNLGMNTISFLAGIGGSFGEKRQFLRFGDPINKKNKAWDCSAFFVGGLKEINPIGGKTYFAGDFNLEVTKRHLPYTRFGLSLDITHDGSEYDCIINQALPAVDRLKTTRIGLSGGYEWQFGDFSLDLYLGRYLYEPNPLYGKVYQRSSLRYPLSDRVKLSIAFRNHKGKADFVGVGIGVRLSK